MTKARSIAACDCETDPFKFERVPQPFLWGFYDGKTYEQFDDTVDFVDYVRHKHLILFAHNGGKFDFIYLLPYVGETKVQIINGRIVSMMLGDCELRDSYAIMPTKLAELGAKKEIEFWKLERENRNQHWSEICDYLYMDCKVLYDAVTNYRKIAGKQKTIASNALAFSKRIGIDPGKSNHRFDANFRPFYFGGRTQCFKPGMHKNLVMLDIRSAYPYAMLHHHATGTEFNCSSTLEGLSNDEINRSFITLNCCASGCFPVRSQSAEGLHFPYANSTFNVTGWEYQTAKKLGLITNIEIINIWTAASTITFKPYIQHWYEQKSRLDKKKEPAQYYIAKTMMNSLYGKLAQNPARYFDYKIVLAGTPIDHDEGWELAQEYDKFEIHRRETLWKYIKKYGDLWITKPLYKNVATGASITGFVRAYLLQALYNIGIENVIYCDTDSIIATANAKLETFVTDENIGSWEIEDTQAPVGYFAGKKLYAIKLSKTDAKTGKKIEKIASKGAKLTFDEIRLISQGETITWQSEAPAFNFLGAVNAKNKTRNGIDDAAKFIVRNIRSTAANAANH